MPSLNDGNAVAFREILWQEWTTVIHLVQGHIAVRLPPSNSYRSHCFVQGRSDTHKDLEKAEIGHAQLIIT